MISATQELLLKGTVIAPGIAIGSLFFLPNSSATQRPSPAAISSHPAVELERFQLAIDAVAADICQLQSYHQQGSSESAALLGSQLQLLSDPSLIASVEEEIVHRQSSAEEALERIVDEYQKKFLAIGDLFFSERFQDMQEISERLMAYLRGATRNIFIDMPSSAVVVSPFISVSVAIEALERGAIAFITAFCTSNCHAAIIAKAKGIPFISAIDMESLAHLYLAKAVVNGERGELHVNPKLTMLRCYSMLSDKVRQRFSLLAQNSMAPAQTADGHPIALSANIDMLSEVHLAQKYGSSGIGLFRTEYLFFSQSECPSEAQQYAIYRQVAEMMPHMPVVIRSFDICPEKLPRHFPLKEEQNALLGCRAIRFLLQERQLFKTQLRAIMRANVHGNICLLLPMISSLSELQQAKEVVCEVEEELGGAQAGAGSALKIGCMIEVPSAALTADLLAKECDFFSIGTNDLIQYALAVDRENFVVRNLYAATHPAILRLIKLVAVEAKQHGISVTVCGEMAADPRFTALLLGLGVTQLSVAPRHLPLVKQAISQTNLQRAHQLTQQVLSLPCSRQIEALLDEFYAKNS